MLVVIGLFLVAHCLDPPAVLPLPHDILFSILPSAPSFCSCSIVSQPEEAASF